MNRGDGKTAALLIRSEIQQQTRGGEKQNQPVR